MRDAAIHVANASATASEHSMSARRSRRRAARTVTTHEQDQRDRESIRARDERAAERGVLVGAHPRRRDRELRRNEPGTLREPAHRVRRAPEVPDRAQVAAVGCRGLDDRREPHEEADAERDRRSCERGGGDRRRRCATCRTPPTRTRTRRARPQPAPRRCASARRSSRAPPSRRAPSDCRPRPSTRRSAAASSGSTITYGFHGSSRA